MNYTKLKKEKLELNYRINKIDNILNCEENLNRYIETIENSKLETPSNLNNKIIEKLKETKHYELNLNENIKDNKKDYINIEQEKIKEKINKRHENKKVEDKKLIVRLRYKFIDIIKIAACTVFALMIWEITPMDTTYAKKNNVDNTKQEQADNKNEINIQRKVNDFFMSPIKIERREK